MANELQPRYVIAGEPSRLEIGVAEAGFVDAICEVRGRGRPTGRSPSAGTTRSRRPPGCCSRCTTSPSRRSSTGCSVATCRARCGSRAAEQLHVVPDRARVPSRSAWCPVVRPARRSSRGARARGRARRRGRSRRGERRAVRDRPAARRRGGARRRVRTGARHAPRPDRRACVDRRAQLRRPRAARRPWSGVPATSRSRTIPAEAVDRGRGRRRGSRGRGAARVRRRVARVIALDRFDELASGLEPPRGCGVEPVDGHVYAGGEGGEIYAVTLDGEVRQVGSSGGSMLGVAVDGRGRVYACDAGKGEIARWDPVGRAPSRPTPAASAAATWIARTSRPSAPTDRLYVTCSGEDDRPEIVRIATRGRARRTMDRRGGRVPERCAGDARRLRPRRGRGARAARRARADPRRWVGGLAVARRLRFPIPIRTASRSPPTAPTGSRSTDPMASCASIPPARSRSSSTITWRRRSTRRRTSHGWETDLDRAVIANVGDTVPVDRGARGRRHAAAPAGVRLMSETSASAAPT